MNDDYFTERVLGLELSMWSRLVSLGAILSTWPGMLRDNPGLLVRYLRGSNF